MQKSKIALFVSATLCLPTLLWAEEIDDFAYSDEVAELSEVIVQESSFSQKLGTQRITAEEMARRPTTNGHITDLLKNNPNVRFSSSSDNSESGGEIAPNEVSFHGEKYYDNAFIINGMSNNDNINPGAASGRMSDTRPAGYEAYDLPAGGTQSFWVDTDLLKSVEVFDSNISAEYGNFTGGVIDAKYKDPDLEKAGGKISFRTTRDSFSHFFVDDESKFNEAQALNLQPKFTKYQSGVMLNQPFSDKLAVRLNYKRTESSIQYYHPDLQVYDADRNLSEKGQFGNVQRRISENLQVDGVYLPENGDLVRGTFIYAPHRAKYYKRNAVNGGFTNTGGGYQANIEWEKKFDSGKLTTYLGYKHSGNRVEHDENNYHSYMASDYLNWVSSSGRALTGGFGKTSTTSDDYTLKQKWNGVEFDWGNVTHKLKAGWEISLKKSSYKRDESSRNYTYRSDSSVVCNGDAACIEGNQYAYVYQEFLAKKFSVRDNTYSAYIEDTMKWKRLQFTAGLRMDYNQFFGKLNFAHRLSGSYDVFGNGNTHISTGLSRYYRGSLLAYKFRQNLGQNLRYRRSLNADGTLADWGEPTNHYINYYNTSELENPYSDEVMVGLTQKMLGSEWTAKWVHRNSKKSLVKTYHTDANGTKWSVLDNSGWIKNDTFTLTIKPENNEHKFEYVNVSYDFGFSYNRTKSNNRYYEAEDNDSEYIIHNYKLLYAPNGLVPEDFNEPWKITASLNLEFPKLGLNWGQRLSYIQGRKYLYKQSSNIHCNGSNTASVAYREACGDYVGEVPAYSDAYRASHLLLDWRFSYKLPTFKSQYIQLDLDINNVLNRKAVAKSADGNTVYKMGRNYWLGASYNW